MRRKQLLFSLFCTLIFPWLNAQLAKPGYTLERGSSYILGVEMIQNTVSDNNDLIGGASLTINCKIIFKVFEDSAGIYTLKCHYKDPKLSFISPNQSNSVSSLDPRFSDLHLALERLEEKSFQVDITRFGEIKKIAGLDEAIERVFEEINPGETEAIKSSIIEGFGNLAFKSLVSIALNVYNSDYPLSTKIHSEIYFNAKAVEITNRFYLQKTDNNNIRIQGIGMIPETKETFHSKDLVLETSLNGQQTYDYLFNGSDGWIIEGMSKQKINTLSRIEGEESLPEGLKIPSYTATEYSFRGKKLNQ